MIGNICIDKETESPAVVVETHKDTRCDEFHTGDYNWDKSEKTVADYDSNEEYSDSEGVVGVVYPSGVLNNRVKVYHVPESRIMLIDEIV